MHRIERNAVAMPNCLSQPPRRYKDLGGAEKEAIRLALLTIQNHRCAYCERRTGDDRDDGHIEHFRNQANHIHLECEWTNMFWSCNDEKTCGKHKDKCTKQAGPKRTFVPEHIIDPANEDPEAFLFFVSDGTVRPIDGLSDSDLLRAEETLRVFQLADSPYLRKSREDAVKPYINIIEMLVKANPDNVASYVNSELCRIAAAPFSTAIKSFLQSVI